MFKSFRHFLLPSANCLIARQLADGCFLACKRPCFALQKVTFQRAKHGFLQRERWPFAAAYADGLSVMCRFLFVNRVIIGD